LPKKSVDKGFLPVNNDGDIRYRITKTGAKKAPPAGGACNETKQLLLPILIC
jgi:hypothetical protein